MSLFGLKVAKQFGGKLPSFKSQNEAEAFLFQQRDERLQLLLESAKNTNIFATDFSQESLKNLESWYFALWESSGFDKLRITREEFESCMASYFGEVVVRNHSDAKWVVQEFAFQNGRYEIGVQRRLGTVMLSRFTDHYKQPNNKRRQNLFKMYQKYFSNI